MTHLRRLLLISALFTAGVMAAEEAPAGAKAPETTALEDRMGEMSTAFRKLRRQAMDPAANAASLELVATMRTTAEAALELSPARMADLPEAERPKFLADYQSGIKRLLELLAQVETALKAGDNGAAEKLVKRLAMLQKASHREFKRPDRH